MATFTQSITATANDGNRFGSTWDLYAYNYLGTSGGSSLDCYFRFTNVTIPKDATITSASLTLKAGGTSSGSVVCNIGVSAEDSASMPSSVANANGRGYAGSPSSWTIPNVSAGSTYASQDFASSVQDLVNRSGWASGNNLLVMVRNNGSSVYRTFNSYDNGYGSSLSISYTDPATGQPVTLRFAGTPGMRIGGQTFGRGW